MTQQERSQRRMRPLLGQTFYRYWDALYGDEPVSYTHLDVYKRQGDVNIGKYDNYFAAIRPGSSYVPYEAALEQLLLLPNGTYTLSAYVYSVTTAEDKENGAYAKMYVYEDDGLEAIEIDLDETSEWTRVVIPDITITNGKCRIGFGLKSVGAGEEEARALAIDDVVLSIPAGTVTA